MQTKNSSFGYDRNGQLNTTKHIPFAFTTNMIDFSTQPKTFPLLYSYLSSHIPLVFTPRLWMFTIDYFKKFEIFLLTLKESSRTMYFSSTPFEIETSHGAN